MEKPEAGEITYSVGLPPADLPLGGIVYDKDDFPHYRSSQAITEDYLAAHRLGWRHRLAELDLEWNLERMPIALLQGYVWQQRGLGEGHKACQERVKAIAEEYGPEHAREAVHRALEKMRRASR